MKKGIKPTRYKFRLLDGRVIVNNSYQRVESFSELPADKPKNSEAFDFVFVKKVSGARVSTCGIYEHPRGFYKRNEAGAWEHVTMIKYEFAGNSDGTEVEWVEVDDTLWVDISEIENEARLSDRRNSGINNTHRCQINGVEKRVKIGQHIPFSDIENLDGAAFSDGSDILGDYIRRETVTEQHERLQRGVAALKPNHRALYDKRYIHNRKNRDIAKEAGVSEANISQQLKKIRQKLAEYVYT